MVTEIELKYSIFPADSASSDVSQVISQLLTDNKVIFSHESKKLSNHYFDTPALALRKQRIALRTRGTKKANETVQYEQTIKKPGQVIAGLHQRPEYNVDIDSVDPVLTLFPHSLWQNPEQVPSLQQNITELFSTHFTRETWLINYQEATIELAFDDGEIACENFSKKPKIFELELELINGLPPVLFAVTRLLFSELSLRAGQLTKAARGYALNQEKLLTQLKPDTQTKLNKAAESETTTSLPEHVFSDSIKQGVDSCLTKLQLGFDEYVAKPNIATADNISNIIFLLSRGFDLYKDNLSPPWLAIQIQLETLANDWQQLSEQGDQQAMLRLIHSEFTNQLQLTMLALLVNKA